MKKLSNEYMNEWMNGVIRTSIYMSYYQDSFRRRKILFSECTSPEFLVNVSACFADKFLGLLPNSYGDEYGGVPGLYDGEVHTGRRLMAFGDRSSHDGAMRENVLNTLSEGFFAEHKQFMDHLLMAVKVKSLFIHRDGILRGMGYNRCCRVVPELCKNKVGDVILMVTWRLKSRGYK